MRRVCAVSSLSSAFSSVLLAQGQGQHCLASTCHLHGADAFPEAAVMHVPPRLTCMRSCCWCLDHVCGDVSERYAPCPYSNQRNSASWMCISTHPLLHINVLCHGHSLCGGSEQWTCDAGAAAVGGCEGQAAGRLWHHRPARREAAGVALHRQERPVLRPGCRGTLRCREKHASTGVQP